MPHTKPDLDQLRRTQNKLTQTTRPDRSLQCPDRLSLPLPRVRSAQPIPVPGADIPPVTGATPGTYRRAAAATLPLAVTSQGKQHESQKVISLIHISLFVIMFHLNRINQKVQVLLKVTISISTLRFSQADGIASPWT